MALEQRDTKLAFEFVNAAGHGGLRDAEIARGRPQAAAFGDSHHVAQLGEFHCDTELLSIGAFCHLFSSEGQRQDKVSMMFLRG
jgi:hypothetical protein